MSFRELLGVIVFLLMLPFIILVETLVKHARRVKQIGSVKNKRSKMKRKGQS